MSNLSIINSKVSSLSNVVNEVQVLKSFDYNIFIYLNIYSYSTMSILYSTPLYTKGFILDYSVSIMNKKERKDLKCCNSLMRNDTNIYTKTFMRLNFRLFQSNVFHYISKVTKLSFLRSAF